MKKLIILVMVLFVLSICVPVLADSSQVRVTLVSQDPDPVEPGQIVDVKFKIENEGSETRDDAIVRINPQYPFSSYDGVTEKNIGKLRASSTGADAEIVTFKLKVDEEAVQKETELELTVFLGEAGISYTNDEFLINIQTQDAVLAITDVQFTPQTVPPGGSVIVDISVKNFADSLLKDIKFKLDLSDDNLPLAPYQSSSERRLSQLQGGFQDSLQFQLIAEPDATTGLYKVPITITYNDEQGASYSIEEILAVGIGEAPQIRTFVRKTTVQQADAAGIVTLGIANAGTTDIKFLEVTVLESEDFQLVSPTNYFYLGDVDSDDTESEDISIFINSDVEILKIPLQIKYFDANNKQFQQTVELELELFSSGELKKFGIISGSKGWILIVIILILGAGYWYWRRRKKKKAQQQ